MASQKDKHLVYLLVLMSDNWMAPQWGCPMDCSLVPQSAQHWAHLWDLLSDDQRVHLTADLLALPKAHWSVHRSVVQSVLLTVHLTAPLWVLLMVYQMVQQ